MSLNEALIIAKESGGDNLAIAKTSHIREDKIKEEEIKKDKIKRFTPPSQIEVINYFNQNGYSEESAVKAFKYYETGQWKDGKGNQVKNWKQKMQSVWFKEDNKIKPKIEIPTKYNFI